MTTSPPLFTAFINAVLTLLTFHISRRCATLFYRRLLRETTHTSPSVQTLFELTFTLSLSLIFLIFFDALSLLHPAPLRLTFLFCMHTLTLVLIFLLPPTQFYHILLPHTPLALRYSLVFHSVFLYLFYRMGLPPPLAHLLSLQAFLSRILILGTTMLAILSGFTAVHLPYSYLSSVIHPIKEKEVHILSTKLLHSLDSVLAKKRALLDTELRFSGRNSSSIRTLPGLPPDIVDAEKRTSAAFMAYNDAAAAWHDVTFAHTPLGRLFTILGAMMLLLCVIRVIAASYHIAMHIRGNEITKGGAVAVSDKVHVLLRSAGMHVEVRVVYQYATLAFTSVLMMTNLRAMLVRMTSVFAFLAGNEALNSSAAIFVALLMGLYVISSTVLVRGFLPPGSRALISDVLGMVEFQFFQRWFDVLFLSSAVLGGGVLAYQAGYLGGEGRSGHRRRQSILAAE